MTPGFLLGGRTHGIELENPHVLCMEHRAHRPTPCLQVSMLVGAPRHQGQEGTQCHGTGGPSLSGRLGGAGGARSAGLTGLGRPASPRPGPEVTPVVKPHSPERCSTRRALLHLSAWDQRSAGSQRQAVALKWEEMLAALSSHLR